MYALNNTRLWPGWDYAPSMPNAYAAPVLLMLYFTTEIRNEMLKCQVIYDCNDDDDGGSVVGGNVIGGGGGVRVGKEG